MDKYAEVSPTGTGVKVFCIGSLPDRVRRKSDDGGVEMYDSGRYFTVTGQHVPDSPEGINRRPSELQSTWQEFIGSDQPKPRTPCDKFASVNGHAAEAALLAMLSLPIDGVESDGSMRLVQMARQAVLHNLDDKTAVRTIRAYEQMRPFPMQYTDEEILQRVRDAETRSERGASVTKTELSTSDPQELLTGMPRSVRDEAEAMLNSPDLMERIVDDVEALGVAGERDLIASIYLVGVSRLLDRPLAAIVQGATSSGKSYVVERTAWLFPPEAVILATSMTPQSLYYMPPGSLSHRLIVAGERSRRRDDDVAEATRALREMISSGSLSKLVTIKNKAGRPITERVEQAGPIAYVETTSMQSIFEEDANRSLLLSADEGEQQTEAILDHRAKEYSGEEDADRDAIRLRHYAAQRMLPQRSVIVPFALQIAQLFDKRSVVARRAYPHLMGMIQASALLHQYQRESDDDGRVIATTQDYQIASELCRAPLARLLGKMTSNGALDFHDRLTERFGRGEFSTREAGEIVLQGDRTVQGWLKELKETGGVEQVIPHRGNQPAGWRLTGLDRAQIVLNGFKLPNVEDVCS